MNTRLVVRLLAAAVLVCAVPASAEERAAPRIPDTAAGDMPRQDAQPVGTPLSDVLGRFQVTLPNGALALSSSYSYSLPADEIVVTLIGIVPDDEFRDAQKRFPQSLTQMGIKSSTQPIQYRGRQLERIDAYPVDPARNRPLTSMNVLIPGPNLWVQVSGPQEREARVREVLEALLASLH